MRKLRDVVPLVEIDTRSQYDKLKALRDHPNTEAPLKVLAQRHMDRIGVPLPRQELKISSKPKKYPNPSTMPPGHYAYNPKKHTYHGPYSFEDQDNVVNIMRKDGTHVRHLKKHPNGEWHDTFNPQTGSSHHTFDIMSTWHKP